MRQAIAGTIRLLKNELTSILQEYIDKHRGTSKFFNSSKFRI